MHASIKNANLAADNGDGSIVLVVIEGSSWEHCHSKEQMKRIPSFLFPACFLGEAQAG